MVRSFVGLRITANVVSGVRYVYVSALRWITMNGATDGGTVPAAKCRSLPNAYEFLWRFLKMSSALCMLYANSILMTIWFSLMVAARRESCGKVAQI
jgi:hypothetical protein